MASPPVIRIDVALPTPAYRQIANALRAQLVAGAFAPGAQLPTVRQLALDLGVHHNTVAEAYRMLSDEGWVDLRRRTGVTVLERTEPKPSPETHQAFARRLEELAAEARADGLPLAAVARELRALADKLAKSPPGGRR
jgi:GntR family transcriptional regulator